MGYHTITPYLAVKNASDLVEFLKRAFGAEVTALHEAGGKIMNGELRIGTSMLMLGDIPEGRPTRTCMFYLYVEDVDGSFARAEKAGAKVIERPADQHYVDRRAGVSDDWGND